MWIYLNCTDYHYHNHPHFLHICFGMNNNHDLQVVLEMEWVLELVMELVLELVLVMEMIHKHQMHLFLWKWNYLNFEKNVVGRWSHIDLQRQEISFINAGEIIFVASNSIYVASLLPSMSHKNCHLLLKSSLVSVKLFKWFFIYKTEKQNQK